MSRRRITVDGNEAAASVAYRASEPELLAWVQATASFGFLQAYRSCVHPLTAAEVDRYYEEGREAARLYGVPAPPASEAELDALFESMRPHLERSDTVFEFLAIVRRMPALPWLLRPLQAKACRLRWI